ncbi:hypothetical protein E2C01_001397 [Portunus trituberculatus]|uniref:Uncharacterized protein n=1 Tax=Portunus trituberculatus TaxID=210409 RepID=A0A5B7CJB2_PORTR|nr:hypothetical protein [Portunus trituberculatus]
MAVFCFVPPDVSSIIYEMHRCYHGGVAFPTASARRDTGVEGCGAYLAEDDRAFLLVFMVSSALPVRACRNSLGTGILMVLAAQRRDKQQGGSAGGGGLLCVFPVAHLSPATSKA